MTKNKNILSTLMFTLLLGACGSSTNDQATDGSIQADDSIAQETQNDEAQHEATKLVATPVNNGKGLVGDNMDELKSKMKKEVGGWLRGRVQFLNLEGGFYGIIADSGKKILPMNMPKEFAQNGAIVRIKGKVKNVMTIQQWGTPFTITEIELIKPGSNINEEDM